MGKNQPIVGNQAHNKATNNGYARNALGGFFAHWEEYSFFNFQTYIYGISFPQFDPYIFRINFIYL